MTERVSDSHPFRNYLLLPLLAYCLVALIFFGDLLDPIGFALIWPDRLGIPWREFALGCGVLAAIVFLIPSRKISFAKPALFVFLWMASAIVLTGLYADRERRSSLAAFGADATFDHTFLQSLREAPREFQFYLHAAALKDCVPYGWSYRSMAFYRIPAGVAVNVLPSSWIKRCGIHEQDVSRDDGV